MAMISRLRTFLNKRSEFSREIMLVVVLKLILLFFIGYFVHSHPAQQTLNLQQVQEHFYG
jgi:sensor histidine kinase regulating citrate/malate metabolism